MGHSLGPWTGFPSEECAPEFLLAAFPHERVVAAAGRPDLTPNQLDAAARCRYIHQPGRKKKPTRPPIPAPIRERLWAYVQSTADPDKIQRANRILGGRA